jgi:hypothetical protein
MEYKSRNKFATYLDFVAYQKNITKAEYKTLTPVRWTSL